MIEVPTSTSAQRPQGSPFLVDSCAFAPSTVGIDYAMLDLPEDKLVDWPMVYILANEKSAYVGQTTSVTSRMAQHGVNAEKSQFNTATVIYNDEFNASVITDYEHRLIEYMHADRRYQLTNKNDGMTPTNYFSKAEYTQMFDELWEELRRLELAEHTIDELEESEVFKYSPYKGLNTQQRVALDTIMQAIEGGLAAAGPVVVEGKPGTGKTVLAIYLLKMLRDDERYANLNVKILEPVTSLRNTLRDSLKNVQGLEAGDIIGPLDLAKPEGGCIDVLLVDETHRLKRRVNLGTQFGNYDKANEKLGLSKEATQLDWVLKQAKLPILFYDPLQAVGPSCVGSAGVERALGSAMETPIRLESQMRVKGGDAYLEHVRALLDGAPSQPREFDGYDFVLYESFEEFVASFEQTYERHSLSRVVAGYAWPWATKQRKGAPPAAEFDIVIDGIGLRWNCTYDNWVVKGANDPAIAHEVGCIHSIQGYDLSYAYVIVGDDLRLNPETGLLEANKDSYFDRNGSATATPEELTAYIKNIYYVLLTRGILGTYVYVHDPALREYFARYFR